VSFVCQELLGAKWKVSFVCQELFSISCNNTYGAEQAGFV
jgi:hypothetical protein